MVVAILAETRRDWEYVTKLLFLDFDGVLHPNFCKPEECFGRVNILMEALGDRTVGLEVIVSSSWRFQYEFAEILSFLPGELGLLISGATLVVPPGRHQRYREIRAYLDTCRGTPEWRALDDDVLGFPVGCRELMVCDGRVGIDNVSAMRLRKWLRNTD